MKLITGHPTLCCHVSQHRPAPETGAKGGTSPLPPQSRPGDHTILYLGSAFIPLVWVLLFTLIMVFQATLKYLLITEVSMTFFDNLFW